MNFNGLPNERTEALFRLIRDRWDKMEAEADWADCVHLSRFHFQRTFRRYYGETPGELRRRLRLERAAHILSTTELGVTETAFDAGYESLEGFSRAFRRAYGVSPSHYRHLSFPNLHLPGASGVHIDPSTGEPELFNTQGVRNMDVTDRLIDHDVWMTRRLLQRAQQLTDEQLDMPVGKPEHPLPFESEAGTLREALNRLVFTKEVWLAAVRNQPIPQNSDKSIPGLLKRLDASFIEFAEVVRQVRDENRWDEVFSDTTCEPPESFTFGGMIAHVVTFSAFRRSAALKILAGLGVNDLGYGDPIEWEREVAFGR
jgi:AraC-like DNA-binding protein